MKDALELLIKMEIDIKHLQYVWCVFQKERKNNVTDMFKKLKEITTEKEKQYLMYVGLNTISELVNEKIKSTSSLSTLISTLIKKEGKNA